MLSLSANTRIFIAAGATDMRKGFDGLQGLVLSVLEQDPLSGHLFLFVNRRRDKLKILYWDGDGLAIWYRRLEQGTFQLPQLGADQTSAEIRSEELMNVGQQKAPGYQRTGYQRTGYQPPGDSPLGATTQVSLLPPPWEELTTSEPFRNATRVKPPGKT